jgi:hypothetical protein
MTLVSLNLSIINYLLARALPKDLLHIVSCYEPIEEETIGAGVNEKTFTYNRLASHYSIRIYTPHLRPDCVVICLEEKRKNKIRWEWPQWIPTVFFVSFIFGHKHMLWRKSKHTKALNDSFRDQIRNCLFNR